MGAPAHLPATVIRFIEAHIPSLAHLELLLLLMQAPGRWWDPPAVSGELGIGTDAARRALDHLASSNLLAISVTAAVRYQYQPGRADLAEAAAMVADTYRQHRLAVLELVARPDKRGLRSFADAFRIRRDDDR